MSPNVAVTHMADLCPGGWVFMPGIAVFPRGKGCEWHLFLSTAFQGIQCQLFPPEGIAAAEKRKEVTFWPKTIESGSLPHRDCISICDHRLPFCTSVWITSILAMCRMLILMTKFITDPHGAERVSFRQSAGYIGNMPSFSKQSLPQLELPTARWQGTGH